MTVFIPRQGGYAAKTCLTKLVKDHSPNTYDPALKLPTSPFLQSLFDSGNAFEADITAELQAAGVPFAYIAEELDDNGERTRAGKLAKEEATFAAYMDPDVIGIVNPRISARFEQLLSEHLGTEVSDPRRISEPDIIEFGAVLPNGLRAMHFVDVKDHKLASGKSVHPRTFNASPLTAPTIADAHLSLDVYGTLHTEDWLQLAHYYRHARTLGLVADGRDGSAAAIIGRERVLAWEYLTTMTIGATTDDGRRYTTTPVELYDHKFDRSYAVVRNAVRRDNGEDIAADVELEQCSDCSECPWRNVCRQELEAFGRGGHVTLLAGVTPLRARSLYADGIRDVATLAAQDPLAADEKTERMIHAARVRLNGRPHLVPDRGVLDLPRADIEVDFDCEADEFVYMWGVRVNDRLTGTVTEHMLDDYTGTPEGEARVLADVWALFTSLSATAAAANRSIRFYHYSHFERTQMVRLAEKYAGVPGVPSDAEVFEFYDHSGAVTDLFQVLSKQVIWPTANTSIKTLATHAGFSWRDETPGGDMSMLWYREASDPDNPEATANRDRLRRYNLDDVAAQAHLRQWVTDNPPGLIDTLGPTG